MKPYNREAQRHRADHYRTRTELENAAQDDTVVRRLINVGILELHDKWRRFLIKRRKDKDGNTVIGLDHSRHPQPPYRLNVWLLHELEARIIRRIQK